jgi:hypothetical protein
MLRFALLLSLVGLTGIARADLIVDDTGDSGAASGSGDDGCGGKASGAAAGSALLGFFLLRRLHRRQ